MPLVFAASNPDADAAVMWTVVLAFILGIILVKMLPIASVMIYDFQTGVLFRRGKIKKTFDKGRHFYFKSFSTIAVLDHRPQVIGPGAQELMSKDGMGVRVSPTAEFKIENAYAIYSGSGSYVDYMNIHLQLAAKDIVTTCSAEDLIDQQGSLPSLLFQKMIPHASAVGVELLSVDVREFFVNSPREQSNQA